MLLFWYILCNKFLDYDWSKGIHVEVELSQSSHSFLYKRTLHFVLILCITGLKPLKLVSWLLWGSHGLNTCIWLWLKINIIVSHLTSYQLVKLWDRILRQVQYWTWGYLTIDVTCSVLCWPGRLPQETLESRAPTFYKKAWARVHNHKVMTRGAVCKVDSFSLRQWYCNDLGCQEHVGT